MIHFRTIRAAAAMALVIAFAACEPGPEPIAYGADTCAWCVMGISDVRFGAEIVSATGKIHRFDSVECLASFAMEMEPAAIHSVWVTDFTRPAELIRAEQAVFLAGSAINSPMGMSLLAFTDRAASTPIREEFGGELLEWPALLDRVSGAADDHADHAHAPGAVSAGVE